MNRCRESAFAHRLDLGKPVGSIGADVRHMLNTVFYGAPGIQLDIGKKTLPMFTAGVGIAF